MKRETERGDYLAEYLQPLGGDGRYCRQPISRRSNIAGAFEFRFQRAVSQNSLKKVFQECRFRPVPFDEVVEGRTRTGRCNPVNLTDC